MLQRQPPLNAIHSEEDAGQPLTPSYLLAVLKRRALSFVIPFILIFSAGSLIALGWPALYLSAGKILIQSPEIPTDLVQPTVSTLANERIQIIQQRIMTRENLLAIAKKFNLSMGWRALVSSTEIIDFIRDRTKIEPLEVKIKGHQQQAIAFTVGFEYESPQIATKVANELVTMILNEDVRTRSSFASETTQFLARDVNRIEDQLALLDSQILELQHNSAQADTDAPDQESAAKQLQTLKAQLAVKSATFSASHPDILALKRAIKALENSGVVTKAAAKPPSNKNAKPQNAGSLTAAATDRGNALGLDTLETRRLSLKTELTKATQKLAAARLGENLERGRHSERLVVIEQPTVPEKPVSPNRLKIFALAFIFAFMSGGGLVFVRETTDQSIRRSEDIFSIVDAHLIVPIPYISTLREARQKKKKIILVIAVLTAIILVAAAAAYFYLPPPDVWYDRATDKLMKLLLK
jgi:protein tyrosine kinase modulator